MYSNQHRLGAKGFCALFTLPMADLLAQNSATHELEDRVDSFFVIRSQLD